MHNNYYSKQCNGLSNPNLNVKIFKKKKIVYYCFTYILFNLKRFFLEQKFDDECNRECVQMLWTYLIPSEFYIFICKHDNFNLLNKLSLKYQNASEIVHDFIVENNEHFLKLKEYFKRNAHVYQYIYTVLFQKYFCGVEDYGVKSKVVLILTSEAAKMGRKIYLLFVKCR